MSPFLFIEDEGNVYALQTAFPNYIAVLQNHPRGMIPKPMAGFELSLNFRGTLAANRLVNNLPEAKAVMEKMSQWFWAKVLLADQEKWKKYRA